MSTVVIYVPTDREIPSTHSSSMNQSFWRACKVVGSYALTQGIVHVLSLSILGQIGLTLLMAYGLKHEIRQIAEDFYEASRLSKFIVLTTSFRARFVL